MTSEQIACFNNKGNLLFDPYRCNRGEDEPRYSLIFTNNGYLRDDVKSKITDWAKSNLDFSPLCDAYALYIADRFAHNTKGNYSTIYYFR